MSSCLLTHNGGIYHQATADLMGLECAPPITEKRERSAEQPDQAAGWIEEDDRRSPTAVDTAADVSSDAPDSSDARLPKAIAHSKRLRWYALRHRRLLKRPMRSQSTLPSMMMSVTI